MSQFTTTYFSAPNVSATIVQATTIDELTQLHKSNRHLFSRHAHLAQEIKDKAAEFTNTVTAYPSMQAYRDRIPVSDANDSDPSDLVGF